MDSQTLVIVELPLQLNKCIYVIFEVYKKSSFKVSSMKQVEIEW